MGDRLATIGMGHIVYGSMVDIQSPTAENRRWKKKKERKNKLHDENIMASSIPQGGHNYRAV